MNNNDRSGSFLDKLQQWSGFLAGFLCLRRSDGKLGKAGSEGNAFKRKTLRHEPLEERQLLAVDAFGLSADIARSLGDRDSSCVSNLSCCETTHLEETALVSQSLLDKTVQY